MDMFPVQILDLYASVIFTMRSATCFISVIADTPKFNFFAKPEFVHPVSQLH